jgi:nucleotide-binding universal stress UspA family protein
MSRRIVIAVDATERGLDPLTLGKLLANATGAPVVLATVLSTYSLMDPFSEALAEEERRNAERALRELAASAAVEVADVRVLAGASVARELQAVSEEDSTGVVVVGSTSRGPVGRLLVGGVGERLLAGSASPVAIAPTGYFERAVWPPARIGVAFDGSDEARCALDAGRLLARASGARLRVITVFQQLAFGAVAPTQTGGTSANEIRRAELRDALEAARGGADDVEVEATFLEGPPGEVLAQESTELDLLVTGSRGYGPRAAVLLGSTTATLMRSASCPGLITPRGTSLELE